MEGERRWPESDVQRPHGYIEHWTGSISNRHRLQTSRSRKKRHDLRPRHLQHEGCTRLYTHAVKALMRAGVRLKGDVIIAAVAGEIEKTQWGEFRGKEYRGYGFGTHYLVNHGVLPDMCILGEPTDMHVVLEHFGSMRSEEH